MPTGKWRVRGERQAGTRSMNKTAVVSGILGCLAIMFQPAPRAFAQFSTGPRSRVPVINRITNGGPTHSAFTGRVQSLDRKLNVLDVSAARGQNTAIFPLNKKIKISSIAGQKLKLAALTPGTSIIIYYEQNAARRTVQQIIVLAPGASQTKKKSHPS